MTATVSPTTTGYTNLGLSIRQHFEEVGPMFALDTETAMAPVCFGGRDHVRLLQCWSSTHAFWLDLAELDDADWAQLKDCLEQEHLTLVMQNAAFDIRVLQGCGIQLRGTIHDTMLLSWLLNNGIPNVSNSLEAIAHRELDLKLDKTFQKASWMTLDLKANPDAVVYGMNDVCATWGAFHKLFSKVLEQGLDIAYEVEIKALLPTIQMESTGLYLDRHLLDEQVEELRDTRDSSLAAFIETLDTDLQEAGHEGLPRLEDGSFNLNKVTKGSVRLGTKVFAGFNPGSSTQLLKLFPLVGVEPKDPTGKASIDKKFLASFRHMPVVEYYLSWKRADKHIQMATTLVEAQQDDGRIYARFNQTGTFTGRYSSSGPNLQNIPRGAFRYCFTVPEGRAMVDLDYGGMELRAACSPRIADEPRMREAFNTGRDVHRYTASLMFGKPEDEVTDEERRQAKAVNFGALYGSSANGLVNYFQAIGQTITLKEGEAFLKAWLAAYPKIGRWHNLCRELVEAGAPVTMVDGRRRWLHGDSARHTIMANNIVQGSSASAMKLALAAIYDRLPAIDTTARLVGVIHDEVLIECDAEHADAILAMAEAAMVEAGKEIFGDSILLEAAGGIGDSWGGAKG